MPSLSSMFFGGWSELARIVIVGLLAYAAIVLFLRVAGSRALAKLSAYDLIVTIALGSTLATAILSPGMTLDRALLAFGLLLGLQRLLAYLSMRSTRVYKLTNNDPSLIAYNGRFLDAAMKESHLALQDVEAAVRASGHASVAKIDAIVLETDGTLSVIPKLEGDLAMPLKARQRAIKHSQE